ncbi:MAG: NHLP bacteriocin system secretion protein [Crinalium sp.]
MPQANKVFREEALERLSSPEQLDKLMRVVKPQTWLPLAATGCLVFGVGVWSVVGRIPLTVSGTGVLIRPRNVVQFQASSGGQLLNLNIKPGDRVKQGQVLATIEQSAVKQELELQKAKLAELQGQKQNTDKLQEQQVAQELKTLEAQQQDFEESLRRESLAPQLRDQTLFTLEQKRQSFEESLQREQITPILRQQALAALAEKRKSLLQRQQQIKSLLQSLQQRVEARRRLFEQKVISQDVFLQSQQDYLNNQAQLSEIEPQLKEIEVQKTNTERDYIQSLNRIDEFKNNIQELNIQKTNAERDYRESLNKIDELKTNIKEIEAQKIRLSQENLEKSIDKTNQIQEVQSKIAQLQLKLAKDSQIVSQYDGYVLETSVASGQVIAAGDRLGAIQSEDDNSKLQSIVYLPDKDGKQIKSGMTVQVTPSVVKRERYGGIVGVVTKVSPFPVTTQEIATMVGNQELAKSLAGENGARVQVFVQLQEDSTNMSGYKWSSSKGPSLKISSGTTTLVRAKVAEVAPISYIIPIFRSWTGVY